jgi:hypothetical protein
MLKGIKSEYRMATPINPDFLIIPSLTFLYWLCEPKILGNPTDRAGVLDFMKVDQLYLVNPAQDSTESYNLPAQHPKVGQELT